MRRSHRMMLKKLEKDTSNPAFIVSSKRRVGECDSTLLKKKKNKKKRKTIDK